MKDVVYAILFAVLVGCAVYYLFPRKVVRTEQIPVFLSKAQMDSLELAIRIKVKGELKPKIFRFEDSSHVMQLKRDLDSLKALLRSDTTGADLTLEYHTNNLGRYGDTLDVVASFVTDTILVNFLPKNRQWEITHLDTVSIPRSRGLLEFDAKDVAEIVLAGVLVGILLK